MNMSEIKYYDSSTLLEWEIKYLKLLKEKINSNITRDEVIELLEEGGKAPRKTSFVINLEWNLKGLFELDQKLCTSIVPIKELRILTRQEILNMVMDSIDALLSDRFQHTKRIFEQKRFRVEHDGRLIDVEEMYRKNYDYIFYKATSYKSEYYVDIYYEHRRSSVLKKINEKDSELVPSLELDQIEELISRYQ